VRACVRACERGSGDAQVIATRLLESKRTVPHLYASEAVCIDALIELRTRLNGTALRPRPVAALAAPKRPGRP
jgi:pyruvate/2-oxoglutarate dehydrogenase complex dihydrolipoamide acyltransferase (E2) component